MPKVVNSREVHSMLPVTMVRCSMVTVSTGEIGLPGSTVLPTLLSVVFKPGVGLRSDDKCFNSLHTKEGLMCIQD